MSTDPKKPWEKDYTSDTTTEANSDATSGPKPWEKDYIGEPKKKDSSKSTSPDGKSGSAPANGSSDIKPIDFTVKSPSDLILEQQQKRITKEYLETRKREKELTASYNSATKPIPEDEAEIQSRLNQEKNKSGFMNNLKKVGAVVGDYLNEMAIKPVNQALTMFGETTREDIDNNKGIIPLLDDRAAAPFEEEIKQVKIDARKRKEKLSTAEIQSRAENLFADKERTNLYVDRANSYLDNLSQDDKKILELDRYDDIKNLNASSKKKLAVQSALKLDFKNKVDDYNDIKAQIVELHKKNQEVPKELLDSGIALENDLKQLAKTASDNYDALLKDRSDLGTAEQEYDLFKRENRDWANFGKTIGLGVLELTKGYNDFNTWILDTLGLPAEVAKSNSQDAQRSLDEMRGNLRKPVESIESVEGFVNYASDLVANQAPILAATATGTGGLAFIGATSTGQKYAQMNEEVVQGKATYTPMQMAVAPLLYGGAEVISELPTYSILKKGGRVLAAVENSTPELIKKSAKQQAIAWAKDYGIDMTKELAGEEFTQFAQNFNDKYLLGKKDVGLLDGTGKVFKDTFVLTSILKTAPHVAGAIVKPFQTKEEWGEIDENSRKIIEYSKQLQTEGISDVEKKALEGQIAKLTSSSSSIMAKTIDKIGGMPEELFEEVKFLNKKAGEIKAQALAIDLDGKSSGKDNLIKALEEEYKEIYDKRSNIINGTTTVVDVLPLAEQDKLKRQAMEDLVTELNPDGTKDIEITNEQVVQRANEIYAKSKANEAEGKSPETTQQSQETDTKQEGNSPQSENAVSTEPQSVSTEAQPTSTEANDEITFINATDLDLSTDKNDVQPNDTAPKGIKVGNYFYEREGNEWVAKDKDGNIKPKTKTEVTSKNSKGEVSKKSKDARYVPEKVYEQHAENFDFTQGPKAIENSSEVTTETYEDDVAKYSKNPAEIAETIASVQNSDATEGLDFKSKAIAEAIGKRSVNRESFYRFGDRNSVTGSIALQYLAGKGKGAGIDIIAMNAEYEAFGDYNANEPRITPQDVVDFILENPTGAQTFLNAGKKAKIDALKAAFTEATGLPASEKYISKALEQSKEKTERFLNGDYLYQLSEEDLLTLASELDQFTQQNGEESSSTTVGQASTDQQDSATSQQQSGSESASGTIPNAEENGSGTESGEAEGITKSSTIDQIRDWLDKADNDLDQFGKEHLSMGLPIVVAKIAVKAMKGALNAGLAAADIIQAGIDAVKQTEWYQNLTSTEQTKFERDFETDFIQQVSQIPLGNSRQSENLLNRATSDAISEDDAYDEVRDTFDKARRELENKPTTKEFFKKLYRNFVKKFTDRQYTAKRLLDMSGLKNTKNLIINAHGASGKARMLFEEAYNQIYKYKLEVKIKGGLKITYTSLSVEERKALDEIIQAKRFIAIDKNREARGLDPVSHPGFIDANKSEKFLSKLEKELGTEKFNDLTKRADIYFKTYKKLLNDMLDNGLISKESFDSLNDIDYQPRVFLEFVTDFNGDLDEGKRTNNINSGGLSSEQIKTMSEGDASSLVLNSEWLLTNSLLSRTRAIAMNNVNKRFMTDEFPKAKAKFDAIDPKNFKDAEEQRFYKYFKELSSKVIDNPYAGLNGAGNPKFLYDKTPANFGKMYYYVDGKQHQFFLENELKDSWNDNIDGFLSSDAKEFVSYASGSALVKAIATGNNPAFPIVNTPRDFMFTVTFSDQYSKVVPKAIMQVGKDAVNAIREIKKKDGDIMKKYFEYGGAMDFLSSQGTLKKDSLLGKAIEKSVSPNTRDTAKKVFSIITLHKISAYSELMFRLGIFQRSIHNQLKDLGLKDISEVSDKQQLDDIYNQAVSNARGILDFNQGGNITKDLESVIPYINVAFQGGRVAANAFEKDPVGTSSRVLQVATMASAVPIGLSLALIGMFKDDDDDKSSYEIYLHAMDGISKYQKSKYMTIVTGVRDEDGEYQVLKIAKAQELSPVMSVTDDIYQNMIRKMAGKPKKSAANITEDALFTFNSNVMPVDLTSASGFFTRNPALKATMTYATGHDFFRDEPLSNDINKVPKSVEGINMSTTEDFYKKLGQNYGLSPIRTKGFVEALITSPNTNPFVGFLYGGADAISSDKDAKAIGKELMKNIFKSTGRRVIGYSSDFNRQLTTQQNLQEKIDAIKAKNIIQKEEFNQAAKDYINRDISRDQLNSKLQELEPDDKKRMLNKVKDKIKLKGIDSNILDIKYETDPEAKALMIQYYYGNIFDGSPDSKEVYRQMTKAGGVLTKAVKFEYTKLLKASQTKKPLE